jgi:hypothetical protein
MKKEHLFGREGGKAIGLAVSADEFNLERVGRIKVHDGAHLTAEKTFGRQVGRECNHVQFPDRSLVHAAPIIAGNT